MLILSRRRDEVLIVLVDGREVARISVVDIRADKVRLGFSAGGEVEFVREEVGLKGARELRDGKGIREQGSGIRTRHTAEPPSASQPWHPNEERRAV